MKTLTVISNDIIRQFNPCYDPATITESETEVLPIVEWVQKYRSKVQSKEDIIWLLCRSEFLSDRDLRLFAVWCARSTYALCTEEYPIDPRSIQAINVAERYANGEATDEELAAARAAAWDAALSAAWDAVLAAARAAAWDAALSAAWDAVLAAALAAARAAALSAAKEAAMAAARDAQIDQLLTLF